MPHDYRICTTFSACEASPCWRGTIDSLPTNLRVLEFVRGMELHQLEADLLLRLQLGIQPTLTDLGTLLGDQLTPHAAGG